MKKAIALSFAALVIAGIAIVAGPRAGRAKQEGKNPPEEVVYGPAELAQREKLWAESLTRLEHRVDAKTFETMRAVWKAHLNSRAALERAGAVDNGFYRKQCERIDRLIGLLEKLPRSTVSEAGPEPAKREAKDATQAERVAQITKQLSRAGKLPGELLDAHFAGEQTGNGQLGPSDFAAFYALAVAPADLSAWRAALSKSKTWNRFANDGDASPPTNGIARTPRNAMACMPSPAWIPRKASS